ncbi:MAG: PIG-L deacetylase family protein, partial [Chthoniobacterales bacterium]
MRLSILNESTRLLLFAPHPDDESLGAGVLLQKAVAAGAAVRVVYVTDGENNPWPQRALERRWRLTAADRSRWGERRRAEALAALQVLGIKSTDAQFTGLPDQHVTETLLHRCDALSHRFAQIISAWSPTLLLVPSEHDTHPDHSAVSVLTHLATQELAATARDFRLLTYLVHGNRKNFAAGAGMLKQSVHETVQKRQAIAQHRTQVKFSRRRFMSYASRPELFALSEANAAPPAAHPITIVQHSPDQLRLSLHSRFPAFGTKPAMLYLVGRGHDGAPLAVQLRLTAKAKVQVTNCATGHRVALATCHGRSFAGQIELPIRMFSSRSPLFAKLARRRWFFDE